jgi:hypothetical protein
VPTVDIVDKGILAATAISQLAEIFRSEWLMVVFYGDESGSHGKGDYVISGYIAHKDTWAEFSKMWNSACYAATPRRIEYLKMSQWQHRDGQFSGWSNDDAEEKIHRILSVMGVFLDGGHVGEFTSSVSWDIYNRCIDGPCKQVFNNPYYFNLMQITKRAAQFAKLHDPKFDGKIHFVFDEGNSAQNQAPVKFQYMKAFAEDNLGAVMGPISFASDKDEPALQAADVIAWHHRRNLAGIDASNDIRQIHFQVLEKLTKSYAREEFSEEGLISFNARVNGLIENIERAANGETISEADADYKGFTAAMVNIIKPDIED